MRSFILMSAIIFPQLALAIPTASEPNIECPPNLCTEANANDPTQHSDMFMACCSSQSQDKSGVVNLSSHSQSGTGPSLDGQVGAIDSASTIAEVQTQQADGTNTPVYADAAGLKLGDTSKSPTADVNLKTPNSADDSTPSLSSLESGSNLFQSSTSGSAENPPSSTEPSQNSGTTGASSSNQPQSAGTTSNAGNGNTGGAATSSSNSANGNGDPSSTSPQNSSADTGSAGTSSQNPGDSDAGNPGASSSDQPGGDGAFASNLGSSGTASSDEPQGAGTSASNNGNSGDSSSGLSQGSGTSNSAPQSGTDSIGSFPLLQAITRVFAEGANPNSIVCTMAS